MSQERTVALVTGAGRKEGIGFEVCRQLGKAGMTVWLTARKPNVADGLAAALRDEGLDVRGHALDITDERSIAQVVAAIEREHGRLDVLVNNAASTSAFGATTQSVDLDDARAAIDATLFGTWRTTRALLPLVSRSELGRIVVVSSGAGSHGDTAFGLATDNSMGPGYGIAKAALNAWVSLLAHETEKDGLKVNAVCPGFTATFEGGAGMGARPVADGAASVVWAARLGPEGPTGGFFRDGEPLPW